MYQKQIPIALLRYTVITKLPAMKADSCTWAHSKHYNQQAHTVHLRLCERKYVFIPPVFSLVFFFYTILATSATFSRAYVW